ncbi:Xanthan lyase precursor [compost metagenome]
MWWAANSNRASNVPVDITHAGGTSTVVVDQRTNGGVWNLLGTYTFNEGIGGTVLIRTDGTTGYVIADAIKLVKVP